MTILLSYFHIHAYPEATHSIALTCRPLPFRYSRWSFNRLDKCVDHFHLAILPANLGIRHSQFKNKSDKTAHKSTFEEIIHSTQTGPVLVASVPVNSSRLPPGNQPIVFAPFKTHPFNSRYRIVQIKVAYSGQIVYMNRSHVWQVSKCVRYARKSRLPWDGMMPSLNKENKRVAAKRPTIKKQTAMFWTFCAAPLISANTVPVQMRYSSVSSQNPSP